MKKVKITAIRKVQYDDLMAKYENPIEHTCDVCEGLLSSRRRKSWISEDGKCPDGLCPEAWKTMKEFVEALANGKGNFYDGWMNRRTKQEQSQTRLSYALQGGGRPIGQNPYSAMISCRSASRRVTLS